MREVAHYTAQEWIAGLKNLNQHIVQTFYESEKRHFLDWAKRYFREDKAAASDSYQETILAFLREAQKGKLEACQTYYKLRAHFFRLGRKIITKALVEKSRWTDLRPEEHQLAADEESSARPEQERKIHRAFKSLPKDYQDVLYQYYILGVGKDEIADNLGVESAAIVSLLLHKARKALRHQYWYEQEHFLVPA
jgi:RNA polymerase sigma factor (sigma-70 family)